MPPACAPGESFGDVRIVRQPGEEPRTGLAQANRCPHPGSRLWWVACSIGALVGWFVWSGTSAWGQTQVGKRTSPTPPGRPRLELPDTAVDFPRERLVGVSDLTNGFVESERDSYYGLLAHARTMSSASQKAAAASLLQTARQAFQADPKNRRKNYQLFYDLVTRPELWRGRPVTLRGYIRDLTPMEAGENQVGLGTLYQAHLFTEDSAQFPYVIVCSSIPEGLPSPTARRPTDFITVTGYFYKLWTYRAGTDSGHWSAPLILAHRMEWNRPPARAPIPAGWWWMGGALLTALLLGWRELRRRDRAARRLLRQLEGPAADHEADSRALLKDLEKP